MAARMVRLTFAMLIVLCESAIPHNPSPVKTSADAKHKSVVDMTTSELLRLYRQEIGRLEFTQSQDELNLLLQKAGERVSAFVRNLSNTSAQEQVIQRRFPVANRLSAPVMQSFHQRKSTYYYIILPRSGRNGDSLTEYRTDSRNRPVNPTADSEDFIMSFGYAALCLYLHPSHQRNSNFRYLGRESRPPHAHVIAFAQRPECEDYLAYYSPKSSEAIRFLVQGLVWLDQDSCQILRMRTSIYLPEKKTQLKEQIMDVLYGRVEFDKTGQQFWLPQEVNVSWEFPEWIYRNQHKYSDYHLFSVESNYKIAR
jgi:hypothetical protein